MDMGHWWTCVYILCVVPFVTSFSFLPFPLSFSPFVFFCSFLPALCLCRIIAKPCVALSYFSQMAKVNSYRMYMRVCRFLGQFMWIIGSEKRCTDFNFSLCSDSDRNASWAQKAVVIVQVNARNEQKQIMEMHLQQQLRFSNWSSLNKCYTLPHACVKAWNLKWKIWKVAFAKPEASQGESSMFASVLCVHGNWFDSSPICLSCLSMLIQVRFLFWENP